MSKASNELFGCPHSVLRQLLHTFHFYSLEVNLKRFSVKSYDQGKVRWKASRKPQPYFSPGYRNGRKLKNVPESGAALQWAQGVKNTAICLDYSYRYLERLKHVPAWKTGQRDERNEENADSYLYSKWKNIDGQEMENYVKMVADSIIQQAKDIEMVQE